MSGQTWMIIIAVIYIGAMMFLSWYIGKKTTKDETEFMVGGREFTALMTAVGKSVRLLGADLMRESRFMLPQSEESKEVLRTLIETAPTSDFPVETAKI